MQPLEDIFSSPEKTTQFNANRPATPADGSSDSSGADMDIENSKRASPQSPGSPSHFLYQGLLFSLS